MESKVSIEEFCQSIANDMDSYDSILIGCGNEVIRADEELLKILEDLAKYFEHKNYFIITSAKNDLLRRSALNPKRLVCPYLDNEEEQKQWDLYNKWLSGTLAKKLLVVELGEGFNNPNLIKWPFERIVMVNDKAHFYRAHSMFYQIPPEIKDKSETFKANGYDVLKTLVNIVK